MFYGKLAFLYDYSYVFYKYQREELIRKLEIRPDDKVLVLGIGTGQSLSYLQKYVSGDGLVLGVDLSSDMLKIAEDKVNKNKYLNVDLIESDALEYIANSNESFNVIIAELSLSVIPKRKEVIFESKKHLKDGGRIGVLDRYISKKNLLSKIVNFFAESDVERNVQGELKKVFNNFLITGTYCFGNVYSGISFKEKKKKK